MDKPEKKVDLVILGGMKADGRHYADGEIMESVSPDDAAVYAGSGRARVASDEDRAAWKKKQAAAKAAA